MGLGENLDVAVKTSLGPAENRIPVFHPVINHYAD
jgi:hypothetical protein